MRVTEPGAVVALNDGDGAAWSEHPPQLHERFGRPGQVFEHEADKNRIEPAVGIGQLQNVGLLEPDVDQTRLLRGRAGAVERSRRDVHRNKPRRRAAPREEDRLGADAAAGFEDEGARRICLIVVQQVGQCLRLVAEATGVTFAYDGRPIVQNLSTTIMRGDRIGIIGPNGSGKTTLLRLLLGELEPQQGEIKLGTRREVIYFDQLREQLDMDKSVQENVGEGNDTLIINGQSRHIIGYLQDFLFSPERARSPVSILSGGERNRLLLAKLFTKPSNILVMDEPTNDLDAETLDLLEDLLMDYPGTLLLVSHDREFLNNVVSSTLVLTGDGTVREFVGGYDDWLNQAAAESTAALQAAQKASPEKGKPQKEKVRKLSFNDQRELEALPERIAAIEKEQAALHARLADPDFYRSAGGEVAVLNARLAGLEQELEAAFLRWDELESQKS